MTQYQKTYTKPCMTVVRLLASAPLFAGSVPDYDGPIGQWKGERILPETLKA